LACSKPDVQQRRHDLRQVATDAQDGCSKDAVRSGQRNPFKTSDTKTLAALGTASVENFTPTPGRHAGAESMGTLALDVARLERSFHENLFTRWLCPAAQSARVAKGERILWMAAG
jgi:hypothetical protein